MHPKTAADLTVSDEELLTVLQTRRWVEAEVVRWLKLVVNTLRMKAAGLKEESARLRKESAEMEK
jgi:hypothetical protein